MPNVFFVPLWSFSFVFVPQACGVQSDAFSRDGPGLQQSIGNLALFDWVEGPEIGWMIGWMFFPHGLAFVSGCFKCSQFDKRDHHSQWCCFNFLLGITVVL